MSMVDFVLTGSSGFLGKIIYNILSPEYSILTIGRSHTSSIVSDLSLEIPDLNKDMTVKCVIHAAGKAHSIPKNTQEAEEFFEVNLEASKNLVAALARLKNTPQQFVFISSVAVYGIESGELIDEDHALNGNTPYAKSKIEAERFLSDWCRQNNVKLTILRLPLVVGANPPGNLGAMINLIKRGFYVGIGNGDARRSMVLGEDVGRFLPSVANSGGIYNLTDGVHPTIAQFEEQLARKFNKPKVFRIPTYLIKIAARAGDFLGRKFPLNTNRYEKLTSSLTFSDQKARASGWNGRSVLENLPF